MEDPFSSPHLMDAVPMFRNDSGDSVESPFASALNTPSDEKPLHFESLDGKLLAMGDMGDKSSPRRVALSRGFSKALIDAKNSAPPTAVPLRLTERVYPGGAPNLSLALPEPSTSLISSVNDDKHDLFDLPPRPNTPEPTLFNTYTANSPQNVNKMTPRQCPPMRRDIFSPPSTSTAIMGEHDADDEADSDSFSGPTTSSDLTPRAHSTLRHRKAFYRHSNESTASISTVGDPEPESEPAPEPESVPGQSTTDLAAAHDEIEAIHAEIDTLLDEAEYAYDAPVLPALSPLLPLQIVLFPVYCLVVGAAIVLAPEYLEAVAFPGSALDFSMSLRIQRIFCRILSTILPIRAPSTPIRAFEHWASVAHLHVFVFLATLLFFGVYVHFAAGVLIGVGCAVQCSRAWGAYVFEVFSKEKERTRRGEVWVDGDGKDVVEVEVLEEVWPLGVEGVGGVRRMLWTVLFCEGCGVGDGDEVRFVPDSVEGEEEEKEGKKEKWRGKGKYVLVKRKRFEGKGEVLVRGGAELVGEGESESEYEGGEGSGDGDADGEEGW
ncbi:hypothetical protein FB45DRAFT_1000368 [Roridomyces roridus]|uniref:Uncharacterized protein n=1 Tax=Roridomyces roridus TaxID=1738132 RepID=A0AAD7FWN9_9AGAR|nr:hypothetical protein FB45DRAFT_1000368 [Roridomyces roridus]